MRRDLDVLIDEARRAEAPSAGDVASAREALARRIARGDHVELEPETPEVAPSGGLRAPSVPRAGWAVLGAAAVVAAALLVNRTTPPSKAPGQDVQLGDVPLAAPSSPRAAEGELPRAVSEPSTRPELLREEPTGGVQAADEALQPLPEPPAPPPRAARGHGSRTSAEPLRASRASPVLEREAGEPAANNLAAESRALAAVQRALRDSEFELALQLLREHERQFARGVLLEERAAARSIAACGAGLGEAARESARAFASRYPNSPLRARVRASCDKLDRELPERGP